MNDAWTTVALIWTGTLVLKGTGPVALGSRRLPTRASAVISLVAPALLAALVVYETLTGTRGGISFDARIVGVLAAATALSIRLPLVIVVGVAAAATALVRLAMMG